MTKGGFHETQGVGVGRCIWVMRRRLEFVCSSL